MTEKLQSQVLVAYLLSTEVTQEESRMFNTNRQEENSEVCIKLK